MQLKVTMEPLYEIFLRSPSAIVISHATHNPGIDIACIRVLLSKSLRTNFVCAYSALGRIYILDRSSFQNCLIRFSIKFCFSKHHLKFIYAKLQSLKDIEIAGYRQIRSRKRANTAYRCPNARSAKSASNSSIGIGSLNKYP